MQDDALTFLKNNGIAKFYSRYGDHFVLGINKGASVVVNLIFAKN